MEQNHIMLPSKKTFMGHPAGVFLVSSTEMWERFSYYGLGAILTLFLVAPATAGGFGWDNADAVKLYGFYSGLAFSAPAIGGWIASRYIGERRSIVIGGVLIALGHFLIGAPAYIPWLIEVLSGVPAEHIIIQSEVPIGRLLINAHISDMLGVAGQDIYGVLGQSQKLALYTAYLSKGWGLMAGLGFVIVGTGFLKGPISSIVGKLYTDDKRREAGYTIFMMGVWAGALLAEFLIGVIGEQVGWHIGLGLAGVGMAVGLVFYLMQQQALLGDIGKAVSHDPSGKNERQPLTLQEKRNLSALAVMGIFTIIFSAAYNQYGGVWNLIIHDHVNRNLGGFVVPAAWFIAVTTLSFIILAPIMNRMYAALAKRGCELDVVHKQALGLLSIAAAYAFLLIPSLGHAADPERVLGAGSIIIAYILFAIGDVFIWPPQISAVSRLAPKRYQAFMIGLWYVTYGIGGILAGLFGPVAFTWGLPIFSGIILSICLMASVILLGLRPLILRLTHSEIHEAHSSH